MKQIFVAAALLIGGTALAQTTMPPETSTPPQPDMNSQTTMPSQSSMPAQPEAATQGAGIQGPVAIPRGEAVAPPGYNSTARNIPPEQAAQVISQLSTFDYPPCSRQIQDRCIQTR